MMANLTWVCIIIALAMTVAQGQVMGQVSFLPKLTNDWGIDINKIIHPAESVHATLTQLADIFGKLVFPKLITESVIANMSSIVADFNAGVNNEDARLSIEELIIKYGYPVRKHSVTTEDGYVLSVFHIPGSGPAVFLMHGLLGSADDFVVAGPGSGLAYLLAKEGYDVWMGNARGNKHSRQHVHYQPSEAAFWDFSWHEIGCYDLPAMIDYILQSTGQQTLKYVGHSQGTTSFFVMAAERPEYNQKISLMVALSPVAFMSHMESPIVALLSPKTNTIYSILNSMGVHEFLPSNTMTRAIMRVMCGTGELADIFCANIAFLVFGFGLNQVNVTNLPVIFGHVPSGASAKQFAHYGQGVMSGDFKKFDYGSSENIRKYGSTGPPAYNLGNVVAPVAMFYSDADWLAHPTDIYKLYRMLSNPIDFYKVPCEGFNHIDFVWAKDFRSLIYRRLIKLFRNF